MKNFILAIWGNGGIFGTGLGAGMFGLDILTLVVVLFAGVALVTGLIKANPDQGGFIVMCGLIGLAIVFMVPPAFSNYLAVRADMEKENRVVGSIRVVDVYENFNAFDIDLSDEEIYYYETENAYKIKKDYPKQLEFDGTNNKYNLLVNNKPAALTMSYGGILHAYYTENFYDLKGDLIATPTMEIEFRFTKSEVQIEITGDWTVREYSLIRMFINMEGLTLRIIDQQYYLNNGGNL